MTIPIPDPVLVPLPPPPPFPDGSQPAGDVVANVTLEDTLDVISGPSSGSGAGTGGA